MTRSQKTPVPTGLPARFSGGGREFRRLREFLEIPNTKAVEAVLNAVKDAVPRLPGKPPGAERRRLALTAYYGNPKSRRELWRQALAPHPPAASRGQLVPSLEFIAVQGHDPEFREREVDTAAVEEALRGLPDIVESVTDAPDWQRPALAAWPALQRDLAEWSELPDDRREAASLAVFAVATVLDDLRLLQLAARRVDALADEFATLLNDQRDGSLTEDETPPTAEDDVIRRWQETCDAVAVAARTLGADPLQPELLPEHLNDLSRQVNTLTDLLEPVTEALDRAAPEKLLQRAHDIVAALARGGDSPIARWTDQIAAQWRSAYPLPVDSDVEFLQVDVDRLEAELPDSLAVWRAATHHRADVQKRLDEARRRAQQEDDRLKRLDAQDQEAALQQQIGRAAEETQRARDRIFRIVAPTDQVFDPRRSYHPDEDPTTPEPRKAPESGPKPTAQATKADTDDTDDTDDTQTAGADELETSEPVQDDTTDADQDDAANGDQEDTPNPPRTTRPRATPPNPPRRPRPNPTRMRPQPPNQP